MEWPDVYRSGKFKTTSTAKTVWLRAAEAALHLGDDSEEQAALQPKIVAFQKRMYESLNWRFDYRDLLEEFTNIMAQATAEQALDMAQGGLDALHDMMLYRIDDKTIVPAKDVFVLSSSFSKLETVEYTGTKPPLEDFRKNRIGIVNPQQLDEELFKYDACAQVDAWYKYGVLEQSAAVLAKTTLTSQNLSGLTHNKVFVLLGVTSEMGPAKTLLQIPGTTVLGIARGSKKTQDLIEYVQFNSPQDTCLKLVKGGADLLYQGPQIAQWILDQTLPTSEIVLCPLAYMDGEANVRVCVAMDLILQRICRQRKNTMISQYLSPATVMVLPPTAATVARKRLEERPSWEKWAGTLSGGRWLQPSLPECVNNDYTILNGLITVQGPNYALAKTMQLWRCMLAQYRDDHIVAAPFAPATRTKSMMRHSTVATALEGMQHFAPMIAFDTGPASTLLAAILLSQLQFVNRPLPDMEENPFTIFWDGAVHGGVWTCPYSLESVSTINWVLGKAYYPKGFVPEGALPPSEKAKKKVNKEEEQEEKVDMFADSQLGEPMPDCVRERLEMM
jgi:hypothetical protein